MKPFDSYFAISVCLAVIVAISGCAAWEPARQSPPTASETGDIDRMMMAADRRERLLAALSAYEAVLAVDPTHYRALTSLGRLYILLGTGYTTDRSEKNRIYRKALFYNELAMHTNAHFKQRVDNA